MTQGFYGNSKGKFNGTPSLTLVTTLLTPNLVVGKIGARSLYDSASAASLLQLRLPAGVSPAELPVNSGDQNLLTAVLPLVSGGKFANNLLGTTITLSLNVRFETLNCSTFTLRPRFAPRQFCPARTASEALQTTFWMAVSCPSPSRLPFSAR